MSILGKTKGKSISRVQFNLIINRFLIYLKRELRITYDIPIIFIDDAEFSKQNKTFGFVTSEKIIYISIINRHPMDILRTLAHECVHYKYHVDTGTNISSKAGSRSENQANAKAGEIIRKYGQLHPELFDYTAVK